jgi:hypothetical protein
MRMVVLGVVRDVIAHLIKSIPDYALKALGAFFRWYSRLGLFAMFITTTIIGAAAISILGSMGFRSAELTKLQHVALGILVAWLLIVLIVGMIRPGRR